MARELAGLAEQNTAASLLYGVRPEGVGALLSGMPAQHAAFVRAQRFTGAAGQILLLPGEGGADCALLGLGNGPAIHAFGAAAGLLPPGSAWQIAPGDFATDDAALGFLLGAYRYDPLKSKNHFHPATLARAQVSPRARAIADAICLARDLINTPPNLLGPAELAAAACDVGAVYGAEVERITGAALSARYPAMAAVGAGSARGPEAVVLRWQGSDADAQAPFISYAEKACVLIQAVTI